MPQIIQASGRTFEYETCGLADGFPIFYCHGFPGCHLDGSLFAFDRAATRARARIISVNRPGIGRSDFKPGRTLLDWAADLTALADVMHLERFSVLGISGGGPYALACAAAPDRRLHAVSIISSMVPADYPRATAGLAMLVPSKPSFVRWFMAWGMKTGMQRAPERIINSTLTSVALADRAWLEESGRTEILKQIFQVTFATGTAGYLYDAALYAAPWGFRPEAIDRDISLWHGEADKNVPIESARALAAALPACHPEFLPGEGHFTPVAKNIERIMTALVAS